MNKGKKAEDYVNELAYNSYLKYWCYPNPLDEEGDKKEICDLLILFFDTILIISVKDYNVKGNYKRYKNKVIEKSSKQLFGAERKLFNSSRSIYIKHPNKEKELFNPSNYTNIFRITVSLGDTFDNYELIDNKEGKGIVNILNKETFTVIVKELDTIKDLIEYLKEREKLLLEKSGNVFNYMEKDLLAFFLLNERKFPSDLDNNFSNTTLLFKNKWDEYISSKIVFIKKLKEENSYFIDELVKNNVLKENNGELLAKELMSLSRFERRIIASNLFNLVSKYQNKTDFLARLFTEYNNIGFLFIYYPKERQENEINFVIDKAMQLYSFFRKTDKIVLLAASENIKQWKFGLFVSSKITTKQELELIKLADDYGWFINEQRSEVEITEYIE